MSANRFSRVQRATAIVPLALLSAAWTASLAGVQVASPLAAASESDTLLPDGSTVPVPTQAIEAPASLSVPEDATDGGVLGGAEAREIVATASTNGIPAAALAAYQRAESVINAADTSCNLTWQLVAAIGRVESNHGRFGGSSLNSRGLAVPAIYGLALDGSNNTTLISDTDAGTYDDDTVFDRAVGPMQFIPSTWAVVGVDADNDGRRDPQDIDDAALATAVYLCSGNDDLSTLEGQRNAVFRYNHSQSYVDLVLSVMDAYLAGDFMSVPNSTVAAGYLNPLPGGLQPDTDTDNGGDQAGDAPDDDAAPVTPADPDSGTPSDGGGNQGGGNQGGGGQGGGDQGDGDDDGGLLGNLPGGLGGGGNGPSLPLPPVSIPPLPTTSVEPVDKVLTLAQAIVQCTLDGLIDNPLRLGDDFDLCVTDYTTKG